MSYIKYTAADGTVHLCHEDSPMLMHWGIKGMKWGKHKVEDDDQESSIYKYQGSKLSALRLKLQGTSDDDDRRQAQYNELNNWCKKNDFYLTINKNGDLEAWDNKTGSNKPMTMPLRMKMNEQSKDSKDYDKAIDDIKLFQRQLADKRFRGDNYKSTSTYDFRERVEKKRR